MTKANQSRKPYVSDLTDAQWAIVEPMIPPAKQGKRGGRPREVNMREVLNTIFSLHRSGCQGELLPHDVLPKSTVYDAFSQWHDDGTWAKMVKALREQTRVAVGREPPPERGVYREPIGPDARDGRARAWRGWQQENHRAQAACVGRYPGVVAGHCDDQCRSG